MSVLTKYSLYLILSYLAKTHNSKIKRADSQLITAGINLQLGKSKSLFYYCVLQIFLDIMSCICCDRMATGFICDV